MKKLLLLLFIPAVALSEDSSSPTLFVNLQLHRDFNREIFTSTVEIFELDKRGSTFFFTDFDYGSNGQQLSYFEISRNILIKTFHSGGLNASLQFNDGVQAIDGAIGMKTIPRTVLGGAAYSGVKLGPFSCEFQALLRQEFGSDMGWQFTTVWYSSIGKTPLEFLGYIDINTNEYDPEHKISFQAEPQLQLRVIQHAYIGTEFDISQNSTSAWTPDDGFEYDKWYVHPTLYVRYDF